MGLITRMSPGMLPERADCQLQNVCRGLVETRSHYGGQPPYAGSCRWGTGFFVSVDENDDPRWIITADCNLEEDGNVTSVRQKSRKDKWKNKWTTAHVCRRNGRLALLELHVREAFTTGSQPARSLRLADYMEATTAIVIGYHRPWLAYRCARLCFLHQEDFDLDSTRWVQSGSKPGMSGSPIISKRGVIGITLETPKGATVVADSNEVMKFLQSAYQDRVQC